MEAKVRSSKHGSQTHDIVSRPGLSRRLLRFSLFRYWRKLHETKCVATAARVDLSSLPYEILYQILLELFNHNKDWNTDLAFFQVSKVNTRFRKIALDMVEREAMDPVRHFLFTENEWRDFIKRSSLLNGHVDDLLRVTKLPVYFSDDADATEEDRETHTNLMRVILYPERFWVLQDGFPLSRYVLNPPFCFEQTPLWRLVRWQKMAGLIKSRGRWIRDGKIIPAHLIDRHLAAPLSLTESELLKMIQIEIFKDAEWKVISIMAYARQETCTLRTCWYLCRQQFLIRCVRSRAIYPIRRHSWLLASGL